MQTLYLMRHGQSVANADRIVAGSHESPLSMLGERQATYAGQTARQYFHFDLIISSPMSRALQTAQLVADEINYPRENILVLDDLRERGLGEVEGKDYHLAPQHNGNYEDAENVPGVEPIDDFYQRMQRMLHAAQQRPEQHILFVCHNGCGRMLRAVAQNGLPMDMYHQPRLENAVIYHLK